MTTWPAPQKTSLEWPLLTTWPAAQMTTAAVTDLTGTSNANRNPSSRPFSLPSLDQTGCWPLQWIRFSSHQPNLEHVIKLSFINEVTLFRPTFCDRYTSSQIVRPYKRSHFRPPPHPPPLRIEFVFKQFFAIILTNIFVSLLQFTPKNKQTKKQQQTYKNKLSNIFKLHKVNFFCSSMVGVSHRLV